MVVVKTREISEGLRKKGRKEGSWIHCNIFLTQGYIGIFFFVWKLCYVFFAGRNEDLQWQHEHRFFFFR